MIAIICILTAAYLALVIATIRQQRARSGEGQYQP
jgi:hypothetical protein